MPCRMPFSSGSPSNTPRSISTLEMDRGGFRGGSHVWLHPGRALLDEGIVDSGRPVLPSLALHQRLEDDVLLPARVVEHRRRHWRGLEKGCATAFTSQRKPTECEF